ncbi:MAG: hypothetical protein ACOYVK_06995 [Bacillota bacterium]
MSKKRKKKRETVGTIKYTDLVIHSSNKLGKHLDIVKTGTGTHKSKKEYDRKKEKSALSKILKDDAEG